MRQKPNWIVSRQRKGEKLGILSIDNSLKFCHKWEQRNGLVAVREVQSRRLLFCFDVGEIWHV